MANIKNNYPSFYNLVEAILFSSYQEGDEELQGSGEVVQFIENYWSLNHVYYHEPLKNIRESWEKPFNSDSIPIEINVESWLKLVAFPTLFLNGELSEFDDPDNDINISIALLEASSFF